MASNQNTEPRKADSHSKKNEAPNPLYKIWMWMMGSAILLAIAVWIIDKTIDSRVNEIAHAVKLEANPLNIKSVLVLESGKLIKNFQQQGADELRAHRAMALLLKMLEEDNVLVITDTMAATLPQSVTLSNISYLDVEKAATKRGMDIDNYQEKMIEQAKEEAREMMKSLGIIDQSQ